MKQSPGYSYGREEILLQVNARKLPFNMIRPSNLRVLLQLGENLTEK